MNKDHVLGMAKSVAGRIKETTGKVVGSRKTTAEGLALRLAGNAQLFLGNLRESIRRLGR